MKICILDIGKPPAGLEHKHGFYHDMFRRELGRVAKPNRLALEFHTVKIYAGQTLPSMEFADGFLITGASEAVYEDHIWIDPLCDFIRRLGQQKIPLVGICFGHQIIAHAYGGTVKPSDKNLENQGWTIGLHTHRVNPDIISKFLPMVEKAVSPTLTCMASHQDQVTQRPDNAHVLSGSKFCPNGALVYADAPILTYQHHPEFNTEFSADLISVNFDLTEQQRRTAVQSLTASQHDLNRGRDFMIQTMLDFFAWHTCKIS